jgi:hypothetical protein
MGMSTKHTILKDLAMTLRELYTNVVYRMVDFKLKHVEEFGERTKTEEYGQKQDLFSLER